MNTRVTPEIASFIFENYLKMSARQIAKHFGFSREVCKNFYAKHNLIVPKDVSEGFRREALCSRSTFTAKEDKFIRCNYLTMPVKTIGKHLNRSGCGIRGRLLKLNLLIPEELIQQRKKDSVFKKGQPSHNKGKKLTEFMSAEGIENSKKHRFKTGSIPHNALPDYAETVQIHNKSGKKYILIKIPGARKLKLKHVYLWENHYKKKVPSKHNIIFKDGNTQNLEIENLECVSNIELMARNTMHRFPQEMREIIQLKGCVTRQINQHLKR